MYRSTQGAPPAGRKSTRPRGAVKTFARRPLRLPQPLIAGCGLRRYEASNSSVGVCACVFTYRVVTLRRASLVLWWAGQQIDYSGVACRLQMGNTCVNRLLTLAQLQRGNLRSPNSY